MMADSMSRFRSSETIAFESVRELREKLLDLRQSGEEGCAAESRLRSRRGVQNEVFQALCMHHLSSFDVDKKVEMF